MYRFWDLFTGPLIECAAPRRLMEIGSDLGWNTQFLLAYCRRTGCRLDILEVKPSQDLLDQLAPYGPEHYTMHIGKSVDMIPLVETPDLVMLDGDHNWRTVFSELSLIHSSARRRDLPMPIILAHDCGWPYARRDMYYNPADFAEGECRPFAYKGMLPGVAELVDEGINGHMANALVEGGPENGVLTAIEDFIAAQGNIQFWMLPFFNGLGIIVPDERMTLPLRNLIESFYEGPSLMEACKELEVHTMRARADLCVERKRLELRTDALIRARALLERRDQRIAELEAALAAATVPG